MLFVVYSLLSATYKPITNEMPSAFWAVFAFCAGPLSGFYCVVGAAFIIMYNFHFVLAELYYTQ